MRVLVCILNWRTASMSLRALAHVVPQVRSLGCSRVCVVDNASGDGSFELLTAAVHSHGWDDVVDVVQSGHNGGFGFGNNVALRRGLVGEDKADFFYLQNSDAFPHPGALQTLLAHLQQHPRVGICGSLVRGLDGEPQTSAFRFPSPWSELERAARLGVLSRALADRKVPMPPPLRSTGGVDWVAGASMLVRRAVLEDVGIFDEAFFLYYEETDLCLRARRAGWEVAWVRASSVAHIGGASTGVQHHIRVQERMPRYVFDSRRHYFLKNHGRATLWAANAAYVLGAVSFRLRRALQNKPDPERPREWLDATIHHLTHP